MKKILITTLLLTTFIFANIKAIVSILPEKTFLKAIGGDKVDVTLMVQPGNSPHTYEPKPSQMREVARAQLYFAIGVEFEKVWLGKFTDLNPSLQVIDLTRGIEKRPISGKAHHTSRTHTAETFDPHIWTSPENVSKIAANIAHALIEKDPENSAYYRAHLKAFLKKIERTDQMIREILSHQSGTVKFMVFHPAWGYFAHAYGLIQVPVEIEGKSPKPREMVALIKEARREKIRAIFTQPEFSDASAKVIAGELHIPVIKISPLAEAWSKNLIRIAKAIAGEP